MRTVKITILLMLSGLFINQPDMTVGQAIDVLTGWLERVANRDPALFQNLMSKLHLRKELLKEETAKSEEKKTKEMSAVK